MGREDHHCEQCGGPIEESNRTKVMLGAGAFLVHQEDEECRPYLERQLFQEAIASYREAKELGYNATYYIRMMNEHGAVQAAKRLLASGEPSDGFYRLYLLKRLDLSIESLVLSKAWYGNRWLGLFTDEELAIADRRLKDMGC